ncbi:MAG: nucleoside triphosphate pyrophosphohydrolase [Glaciecola sp.]|jgi:ATP diphosphatase|nr:nucleoside triphosphate pyrophosphohydrolase [Glaciecola sp.]MDG2100050.1 nucleoside triphosphate pyrophosphohydrolase [Glaciecola sp.]
MQPQQRQQFIDLSQSAPVAALVKIMQQLRDPQNGCPWDIEQTMQSIIPHTIEETYEVADAIYAGDPDHIKEELGDLLFQVVFYAQLGQEQSWFSFDDVAQGMCEKLIRRHPHVFTDQSGLTSAQVEAQWDAIKQAEKAGLPIPTSILANIPTGMTPLMQAHKIQKSCAKVGFDWSDIPPVVAKVQEELAEVQAAIASGDQAHVQEEIGDLLFAVVNLARHAGVKSEVALQQANRKFTSRFMQVEALVAADQHDMQSLELDSLEAYWQQVKQNESATK